MSLPVAFAVLPAANFNITTDQPMAVNFPQGYTRAIIRSVVVGNASVSLTTAAGGVYTNPSKTGPIVDAGQAYSALTVATKWIDCTLDSSITSGGSMYVNTGPIPRVIYLSLTTPQGSAATATVSVFADFIP